MGQTCTQVTVELACVAMGVPVGQVGYAAKFKRGHMVPCGRGSALAPKPTPMQGFVCACWAHANTQATANMAYNVATTTTHKAWCLQGPMQQGKRRHGWGWQRVAHVGRLKTCFAGSCVQAHMSQAHNCP